MRVISRRPGVGSDAAVSSAAGGVPGKRTLTEQVYRKAESSAAAPASPGESFAAASSGARSAVPHQGRMEAAFGRSFAGVQAHVGTPEAQAGLAGLGARAAAFGETVAFAESNPDPHLVAHELAHVVQARNGGGGVQAKSATAVSQPGDASELAADRAADAVVRGEPVPDVGTADGITLHRSSVTTNGGSFNNDAMYNALSGTGTVGERIGANIKIDFLANDLVETPAAGIGLVQTVKSVTDRVSATGALNATRDQGNTAVTAEADEAGLVAANGAAVDISVHRPGRTDANHNPIYGTGFGRADASTTLQQANPAAPAAGANPAVPERGTPSLGGSQRGSHIRNPDGTFQAAVPAKMEDGPGRIIQTAGQSFEMTFEVTALVTNGPMVNTYLGSVEWGWQSDALGVVTLKPFAMKSAGAPTDDFNTAAQTWNAATFHTTDAAATAVPTIDLPITSHHTADPASLTDQQLEQRMRQLCDQILRMDRTTPDYQNIRFEIRALGQNAMSRGTDAVDSGHTYTVQSGDTLWGIAETHLGGGPRWTRIMALNAIDLQDPNRIRAGAVLKMPRPFQP
jgi:nucleoid-associated protein YgaU